MKKLLLSISLLLMASASLCKAQSLGDGEKQKIIIRTEHTDFDYVVNSYQAGTITFTILPCRQ